MSPDDQRAAIENYAAANGATIVAYFDETDSVSGGTTDRVGLNAAVEMVLSNAADGLIVAKVNRFARTLEGGLQTIRRIRQGGKRFIAVEEKIDSSRDDPLSNFLMGFMLLMAEWQLEQLTEGWENTRQRHIENGVANGCPFGYRKDDRRRLEPDPKFAPWVVYIFERRAAGASFSAIADHLTDKGVPTPQRVIHNRWVAAKAAGEPVGKEPRRGGERWIVPQLRAMVDRRTYLGELRSGDPDHQDGVGFLNDTAHLPIISTDLWLRVHHATKTPAKKDQASAPLAGGVRCASCGMRARHVTNTATPERNKVKADMTFRYYRCNRTYSWGRCPNPVGVRADHLEGYMLDAFEDQYVFADVDLSSTDASDVELLAAQADLREADARAKAFYRLPSTAALRLLDDDSLLEEAQAPLLEAVTTARSRVNDLGRRGVVDLLPPNLRAIWPELRAAIEAGEPEETERFRHLLSIVYPAIVIFPGDRSDPIGDRVHVFSPAKLPTDLPGRVEGVPSALRPIDRPV